jgi:type I restriction enzyme, S subunit
MKEGWQIKTLGEVCAFDKVQGIHDGLPYVGLEDIESQTGCLLGSFNPQNVKSATFRFSQAHVLYGRLRPYLNKVVAPSFEGHCSTEIFPLRPCKQLSREFLHYWLLADQTCERINDTCTGARMPRAQMNEVLEFDFPLPPLPEQQRIVALLDEAFAGLATAKANAERNLKNARAIFESHLQSVFSQRGEGWEVCPLEELTEPDSPITYGVVKPGPEGEIRFVRGGDLVAGKVRLTQLRTITREVSDQYKRTLLRGGELLICLVGQPGQVGVAPTELAGANIARQVGLIRLSMKINAEFVRYFLQSAPGAESLGARESGSVQQVINLGELRQVAIPYPDSLEQADIVARLNSVDAESQHLTRLYERKLAALEELKKSLLHQAFNGEL